MTMGVPGTIIYMGPEAFEVPPKYDPMLDMFSFGHLALFTVTQEFPSDLLPSTYQDAHTGRLTPRDEVERRSRYMETLRREFGDSDKLVHLITQCLEYSPARRPSAAEALQKLQQISTQAVDFHNGMTHLQLKKITISRDQENQQLKDDTTAVEVNQTILSLLKYRSSYLFKLILPFP